MAYFPCTQPFSTSRNGLYTGLSLGLSPYGDVAGRGDRFGHLCRHGARAQWSAAGPGNSTTYCKINFGGFPKEEQRMTQLEAAKKGHITEQMAYVAEREGVSPEFVREQVAAGRVVIPANPNHT